MLSVGSNRWVLNFSNRFINLGVSVLLKCPAVVAMPSGHHPCSRSSASWYCGCRVTVPSTPKIRTSRHSCQHLFHSARSAASSWNRTPWIAPATQRSLLTCQRTGDTAKVDPSLTNSNKSLKQAEGTNWNKNRGSKTGIPTKISYKVNGSGTAVPDGINSKSCGDTRRKMQKWTAKNKIRRA